MTWHILGQWSTDGNLNQITVVEKNGAGELTGEVVAVNWNDNNGYQNLEDMLITAISKRASQVSTQATELAAVQANVDLSGAADILGGN